MSSSCLATSMDIPDPLSPLFPIIHHLWQGYIPYLHIAAVCSSSSLLLQQCPVCLVHLTWIVFVMGGRWPYSWCFVGCCRQDLFNIACNILV